MYLIELSMRTCNNISQLSRVRSQPNCLGLIYSILHVGAVTHFCGARTCMHCILIIEFATLRDIFIFIFYMCVYTKRCDCMGFYILIIPFDVLNRFKTNCFLCFQATTPSFPRQSPHAGGRLILFEHENIFPAAITVNI